MALPAQRWHVDFEDIVGDAGASIRSFELVRLDGATTVDLDLNARLRIPHAQLVNVKRSLQCTYAFRTLEVFRAVSYHENIFSWRSQTKAHRPQTLFVVDNWHHQTTAGIP